MWAFWVMLPRILIGTRCSHVEMRRHVISCQTHFHLLFNNACNLKRHLCFCNMCELKLPQWDCERGDDRTRCCHLAHQTKKDTKHSYCKIMNILYAFPSSLIYINDRIAHDITAIKPPCHHVGMPKHFMNL